MIRMARLGTYSGLGLAISSFLGLMARHIPAFALGNIIILTLLVMTIGFSLIAGNVIDHHVGWEPDTTIAVSIGILVVFLSGGIIGWLILAA